MSAELLGETFAVLRRARTLETLHREMRKFTRLMGFERYAYALRIVAPLLSARDCAVTDYPGPWGERYLARGYFEIDPIVAHCERSSLPAIWDEDAFHAGGTGEFWEEAGAFGLRSGLSLAVREGAGAVGVFSLSRDRPLDWRAVDLAGVIGRAHVFAALLHHALSKMGSALRPATSPWPSSPLTTRELECLKWTADGKTAWEIARILGVTERTVGYHLQNVFGKLGAANKYQAAARALALELLR